MPRPRSNPALQMAPSSPKPAELVKKGDRFSHLNLLKIDTEASIDSTPDASGEVGLAEVSLAPHYAGQTHRVVAC